MIEGTKAANSGADFYVATRTATGWETKYTGIPGDVAAGQNSVLGTGRSTSSSPSETSTSVAVSSLTCPMFMNSLWVARRQTRQPSQDGMKRMAPSQPSPDFSHLVFSSRTDFDPNMEGVKSYPGSVYDYDVENQTVTKISKTAAGDISWIHPTSAPQS